MISAIQRLFFFIFILITLGDKIESIGDIIYNNDFIYLLGTKTKHALYAGQTTTELL